MFYYLHHLADRPGWPDAMRVFGNESFRALGAGVTAFLVCLLLGDRVIRWLISLKVGQPIRTREEVNRLAELHGGKAGTPTMGGVLLLGAVAAATLLWARPTNLFIQLSLGTLVTLGALGFVDDYLKVRRRRPEGLSGRVKIAVQLVLALAVGGVLLAHHDTWRLARSLYFPFLKNPIIADMGLWSLLFYALVMVGASNAVNLTDGLDGLASGCTISVALAYAVFTYVAGHARLAEYLLVPHYPSADEMTVLCLALASGAMGFLWFNCHPARVFMGDTGSLSLGGTLALVAICCKQELLLVVVGGVFVIEALSVMLQVVSFKLVGRRIFRMAPLHHHFELAGWKENTVIVRFWIVSAIFALMGLATLKLR